MEHSEQPTLLSIAMQPPIVSMEKKTQKNNKQKKFWSLSVSQDFLFPL